MSPCMQLAGLHVHKISQLQLNGVIILQTMSVLQMVSSKGVSYPLYFLQYIWMKCSKN